MATTNNVTILDLAVADQKPLRKAIYMGMFMGKLPTPIEFIPVKGANSLSQTVIRITDYGTPATRNLDASSTAYKAQFGDKSETLKIIENTIRIDPTHLDIQTYIQDPIEMQIKAYAKALKAFTNDLLINGDPTSDNSQPAGLAFRFNHDAYFKGQSVNANGLNVDADEASLHTWLGHIDEAIDLANGEASYCISNRQTFNKFKAQLRRWKLFDTTKDQFDRNVLQYDNTKFVNAGMKASGLLDPASTGQVIGDDASTSIFGTASTTPMYFCNTGEDGLSILQLHAMRVKKLGVNTNEPSEFVVHVKWPIGFLVVDRFSLSSVQGLDIT